MITIQQIIDFLSEQILDAVPQYIFTKEIKKSDPASSEFMSAYNNMKQTKWYRELADEQWDDGSWGRFHTQDSKAPIKQKFVTTESALGRARELGLSKDDAMIVKCIHIMERYVRCDETWTDSIEKHKDNGRGHLFCRPFLTAANINMFDPVNPVVKPLRDVVVETLNIAFASGCFDENYWKQRVIDYHVPSIAHPGNMYSVMLLQNVHCMEDALQRQYLSYVWNERKGIFYVSDIPPADKQTLEDKRFDQWLRTLELLSGFSLFPEYMKDEVLPHLLREAGRIINENAASSGTSGRYADSWRDRNKRKLDMVLRIARILVKC